MPIKASNALITQAKEYVLTKQQERPPADIKTQLVPRVASFMCHYFVALSDERLNAMVAHDWIDALKEFPMDAIMRAIQSWRDNSSKKPTPADIRKLCIDFYPEAEWNKLQRAAKIARMMPSEETVLHGHQKTTDRIRRPPTPQEMAFVNQCVEEIKRITAGKHHEKS